MTTAVLLMAYGGPRTLAEVEPYYTDIRGGRHPTPELLAVLVDRYAAIGGRSPLPERMAAQRDAVQRALDASSPGGYRVVTAMKHTEPRIEDVVAALSAQGARQIVGVVMAPHWSVGSVGEYHDRARTTAKSTGIEYVAIDDWHLMPAYLDFLAGAIRRGMAELPPASKVVFTAHSLPKRVAGGWDDPYPTGVRETAQAVATEIGLAPWASWSVAYQSAGRTAESWLGPDLLTLIDDLAAADGRTGILVCPCGFVADNLELLYDLDIDARRRAEAGGLAFARTPAVNDDPRVMAGLARIVLAHAGAGAG